MDSGTSHHSIRSTHSPMRLCQIFVLGSLFALSGAQPFVRDDPESAPPSIDQHFLPVLEVSSTATNGIV